MRQSMHLLLWLSMLFIDFSASLPFGIEASTFTRHTKRSISGPVIAANFPDPGIFKLGQTWSARDENFHSSPCDTDMVQGTPLLQEPREPRSTSKLQNLRTSTLGPSSMKTHFPLCRPG